MLTKKAAAKGRVRVGFSLPQQIEASEVSVCGEFNDWDSTLPMRRAKSGEWRASVSLDPGRTYRFRYLIDGRHWENDWAADAYWSNPFGSEDSIVSI